MAISLVATASTDASTGTAVSLTHGFSLQSGDVIIAIVHANNDYNYATDNNGSYPFTNDYAMDNYDSAVLTIFSRVMGSETPSTFDFTLTSTARWAIICRQYRGVDSSVWDVAPSADNEGEAIGGTTIVMPSITILTAGACGLVAVGDDYSPTTSTWTNIDNSYANERQESGQQLVGSWDRLDMSTGASGTTTVTCSSSTYAVGAQCALKPGAATGEPTFTGLVRKRQVSG